jgi:hypothetical protein
VLKAIASYTDPLEGSRTETIRRARRRRAYDRIADLTIVTGYNRRARTLYVLGPDGSKPLSVNADRPR